MTRPIKPRWCARDKAWLVPGEISEVTGRRKYVILRDENGEKVKGNDHIGKVKALLRLQERQHSGLRVDELISAYNEWHESKGSKPSTLANLNFHLTKFGRFEHKGIRYYDRPASSITLRDLARVRESMEERGCQSGYIRHLYAAVLACWRWAARPIEGREPERLLDVNPLEGAERPRKGKVRQVVVPWATIEALLEFAEDRAFSQTWSNCQLARKKVLMLRLVAESGCRPLEACSLEWDWVHLKERVIIIPPAQHKTGWHRGSERIFGLTERMAESLAPLYAARGLITHPRWVFALAGGRMPTRPRFDHWFADLRTDAIEAGIPIPSSMTLYSLRHSLVTQARQGGISYHDLAAHMGHSEQVAETIYSHLDPNFIRAQFDRMHAARTKPSSAE